MLAEIYETDDGRYAEAHVYQEPTVDESGMPDGYMEVVEVYTFKNQTDADNGDFTTRNFYSRINAELFLRMNGYKEVVV